MSYLFYMDGVVLPITPEALKIKVNNKNETITLINDGDVNMLKTAGLTDIEFKYCVPQSSYPFTNGNVQDADYYISKMEELKTSEEPFRFIVTRSLPTNRKLFDTNIEVSLEDYTVEESAKNGFDLDISVKLKQYRAYGTKVVKIKETPKSDNKVVKEEPKRPPSPNIKPYIGCSCIVNGTLHRDSYGNGAGKTLSNYKGKLNFINTNGSHPYHVTTPDGGWLGWVLASAVSNVT